MTDHPLNDAFLANEFDGYDYLKSQFLFGEEDIRKAYDLGKEAGIQVVKDYLKGKEVRIPGTIKITSKEEDNL
jgi:hypothetical protein